MEGKSPKGYLKCETSGRPCTDVAGGNFFCRADIALYINENVF